VSARWAARMVIGSAKTLKPNSHGAKATPPDLPAGAIRAEFPQVGILLLSAHVEVETAIDLLEGGERIGYLLKSRVMRIDDVVDALERIVAGGSVVDPALVQQLDGRPCTVFVRVAQIVAQDAPVGHG
jgi:hypothetical protein